ncbi:hypothetical protein DINM_004047 [Dirofilaria immitis]|nr:hypothetical protein [Dirofilaria immitis]
MCNIQIIGAQPQQTEPLDLSMQKNNEKEIKSLKLSVLKRMKNNQRIYGTSHMLMHNSEKLYLCAKCGNRFTHLSGLKYHITTHIDGEPYHYCKTNGKNPTRSFLCGICGKVFTRKHGLKQHMSTHTNEKPYPCTICGKCFLAHPV